MPSSSKRAHSPSRPTRREHTSDRHRPSASPTSSRSEGADARKRRRRRGEEAEEEDDGVEEEEARRRSSRRREEREPSMTRGDGDAWRRQRRREEEEEDQAREAERRERRRRNRRRDREVESFWRSSGRSKGSRSGSRSRSRSRSPRDEDREEKERRRRHRRRRSRDGHEHEQDKSRRRRRSTSQDQPSRDKDVQPSSSRTAIIRSQHALPSQSASYHAQDPNATPADPPLPDKQLPNFKPTGLLATAANTIAQANGTSIVLKYHEPPEARKPPPRDDWKLFIFKGKDLLDTVVIPARSCWLIGREAAVVDLLAEHPSISGQHAVLQFRWVEKTDEFGEKKGRVKPYLLDLESANGTKLNGEKLEGRRYVELRSGDVVMLGSSEREYVVMLAPK